MTASKRPTPRRSGAKTSLIRPSLAGETLAELRRLMENGDFGDRLPPERTLCEELGVSRPTLRAALAELEREGSVAVDARQGRRVIARRKKKNAVRTTARVVMLRREVEHENPIDSTVNYFMVRHLQRAGYDFVVDVLSSEALSGSASELRNVVETRQARLWILVDLPLAVQHWFQAEKLDCVVYGSCYGEVDLPFVDEDFRTTCRHAAGRMLAAGHRHLGLLLPEPLLPGDGDSRDGFFEGISVSRRKGVTAATACGTGSREPVIRAADRLLAERPRPTAWLICNPYDCLTAVTYLLGRGCAIPGDVSVVCRTSRKAIWHVVPSIARYERDNARFRKKLLQMVLQILENRTVVKRHHRIAANFVEGESLGKISVGG